MTYAETCLDILERRYVYDVRPELIHYYRALVAAVEIGTRRQRRLARRIVQRQLNILRHAHQGSSLAELRALISDNCTEPHRRLLELASTVGHRLLSALSWSVWWVQRSTFLLRIEKGELSCSSSFRQHLQSTTRNLVTRLSFVGYQLSAFRLTHVGFFGATKVDGRNIP